MGPHGGGVQERRKNPSKRGSGHIDPENQGREGKSADEQQAFEKVLGKVLGTQLNR